jgi:hypothetical protein
MIDSIKAGAGLDRVDRGWEREIAGSAEIDRVRRVHLAET